MKHKKKKKMEEEEKKEVKKTFFIIILCEEVRSGLYPIDMHWILRYTKENPHTVLSGYKMHVNGMCKTHTFMREAPRATCSHSLIFPG